MSKVSKYLDENFINEAKLSKELQKALDDFKNAVRDNHGEPLTPQEIKYIKTQVDRLAKGYKGM